MKKSLSAKLREACAQDAQLARAQRKVCIMMAAWALLLVADRAIGFATNAYLPGQEAAPVIGAAVMIVLAFLGTRGYLTWAMLLLQINMAVSLLQFVSTCFFYEESIAGWAVAFYGVSAAALIGITMLFFWSRDIEYYRAVLRELKGKKEKGPLFYRTNNRLVRNKKH